MDRCPDSPLWRLAALWLLLTVGLACNGAETPRSNPQPDAAVPEGIQFTAMPVNVYVTKVKNILVGLPASPDEIARVQQDKSALVPLIREWQQLPAYRAKTLEFLGSALQQSQANAEDFDALGVRLPPNQAGALLLQNLRESVARTAWHLIAAHRPFNEILTTHDFMMTPAVMMYYAQLDTSGAPDAAVSQQEDDYAAWRWVHIAPPGPGQAASVADFAELRQTTELRLQIPRVGFFTTPAFLAQWQTNVSNQARVTFNQTLITALGEAIDGSDPTMPPSLAALDEQHAPDSSPCFSCHRLLDPMRQFFRQTYDLSFHLQTDPNQQNLPGMFAVAGVSEEGQGIGHLGELLASSPRFATAWTQKLCTYATSAPCDPQCPEFQRVVQRFVDSRLDFNELVVALFASPVVTYERSTRSVLREGEIFSIVRRRHWCTALKNRLKIDNPCGDLSVANALPDDTYSRGAPVPILVTQPDVYFYAGVQQICLDLAPRVVDQGPYSSSDPNGAITDMARNLMGITPPRAAGVESVLREHFVAAQSAGASPAVALQSTFTVACSSPVSVGLGL